VVRGKCIDSYSSLSTGINFVGFTILSQLPIVCYLLIISQLSLCSTFVTSLLGRIPTWGPSLHFITAVLTCVQLTTLCELHHLLVHSLALQLWLHGWVVLQLTTLPTVQTTVVACWFISDVDSNKVWHINVHHPLLAYYNHLPTHYWMLAHLTLLVHEIIGDLPPDLCYNLVVRQPLQYTCTLVVPFLHPFPLDILRRPTIKGALASGHAMHYHLNTIKKVGTIH